MYSEDINNVWTATSLPYQYKISISFKSNQTTYLPKAVNINSSSFDMDVSQSDENNDIPLDSLKKIASGPNYSSDLNVDALQNIHFNSSIDTMHDPLIPLNATPTFFMIALFSFLSSQYIAF